MPKEVMEKVDSRSGGKVGGRERRRIFNIYVQIMFWFWLLFLLIFLICLSFLSVKKNPREKIIIKMRSRHSGKMRKRKQRNVKKMFLDREVIFFLIF